MRRPHDTHQMAQEMDLHETGYVVISARIAETSLARLRERVFMSGEAGRRCLLDDENVRDVAADLREQLVASGVQPHGSPAIQAIAFDKTADANWKVTWHQDVMFPFARRVSGAGFELPCQKDGVDYARPPREVLETLLAVRLHLDDCGAENGPLRISPGSHRHGIIPSSEIASYVERHGEVTCEAREGELLLMKPLLLHASSPARQPGRRRVLHIVYHSGGELSEHWHRTV